VGVIVCVCDVCVCVNVGGLVGVCGWEGVCVSECVCHAAMLNSKAA
jgi:hypothetical protein